MSAFIRQAPQTLKFVRSFSQSSAARNVNKVLLVGRVGSTPTVNEFNESRRVYNYSLATSETRIDKEENLIKNTQWHRIAFFTSTDWFSKIKTGDMVYVEGTLRYSDYTDKEGISRSKAEITQTGFKLLSSPRSRENEEEED